MSQIIKILAGFLAFIFLVVIISIVVWMATTVNQLEKDRDKIEVATQKLTDDVKTIENQNQDTSRNLRNIRKDIDSRNAEVDEVVLAMGRQISDIKKVLIEQDVKLDTRISVIEQKNKESGDDEDESKSNSVSQKSDAPAPRYTRESQKMFVDVNNPAGKAGWEDKYEIKLTSILADKQNFRIDWYKPHRTQTLSDRPPEVIKAPKFKNSGQLYFFIKLGDTSNERIAGVIDFAPTDKEYFPYDLYVDKDRNGDLSNEQVFLSNANGYERYDLKGIKVFYKDGSTQDYALHIYAAQSEGSISIWYGTDAGRYGILEADKKRIGVLIVDSSGNGLFNDADDDILMDWGLSGMIDGSSRAQGHQQLYSVLDLPGGQYRVTEIDPAGRKLTLTRMH